MMPRSKPWEIAADLETAAQAVASARLALVAVHKSAWPAINALPGIEAFDHDLDEALQALSDKYQAIADAEPDDRIEQELRTGFREEDFA